ncbi:hypothetical protein FA15DRAFT_673954 [Coprinopsis marcescibilis]|uniref:RING-type domain-containing protein n=1 Tax=Coprinopsis marcescibilis TaxID=230819 RepID=A0A5C3KIK7_COPMA|nr:hypothetical protein FA15DRAFT_673954 [Coprinopsis marcescibilis]
MSLQITTDNGTRRMSFGVPAAAVPEARASGIPTMTEFLTGDNSPDRNDARITAPMMAYLLALLGSRDPLTALVAGGSGMPENGRMGDYVFNQEALDQIITQLMENSNAHRPVPATDEIINKLSREVLTVNSVTLREDCAVCKEQFRLETEDPAEQVVIKLPCKHPFHEPCIIPWLKSSGTCPVCRFALIPQPSQHPANQSGTPTAASSSSQSPPSSSLNRPSSPSRSSESSSGSGGFIHNLFSHFTGGGGGSNSPGPSSSSNVGHASRSPPQRTSSMSPPPFSRSHHRSSSDSSGSRSNGFRQRRNGRDHLPGGWEHDLD